MSATTERAVLISGCSSGIGSCLAHGLRARGYRVFAGARKAEDVAALKAQGFEAVVLDLDSSDSIRAAADEVLRHSRGRLYALINNAGVGIPGAVEDLSRAALRAQFEVNVFGTQELTNRVLPALRQAGTGRIVQISSLLGIVALAYRGAYTASKFALEALSDTLRLELRGTGVYVVLIEPGPIASRFRENAEAGYRQWIDPDASAHRDYYRHVEARLVSDRPQPFTLPPTAVLKEVIKALESRRPRARYPVTFPAHLVSWLRRVLSDRWLDALRYRISGGGRR